MKKLMVCALMTVACAAFAAEEVTSVNIVGYSKVPIPPGGGATMVALAFDAFDSTLLGIFGTNQLAQNVRAGNADSIYIWNTAESRYDRYYQRPDGQFYQYGTGVVSNPVVEAGMSFWVSSPMGSVETKEITLMGEVVSVNTQMTAMVNGQQMVAYPFSSEMKIKESGLASSGATASSRAGDADSIYVWTGGQYVRYYLDASGQWYIYGTGQPVGDADVIPVGQGFWYEAKAPFTWVETNRYLHNLR